MVEVGTGTSSTRFLARDYPNTEGLEAGTTKQEGTKATLEPEQVLIRQEFLRGL